MALIGASEQVQALAQALVLALGQAVVLALGQVL